MSSLTTVSMNAKNKVLRRTISGTALFIVYDSKREHSYHWKRIRRLSSEYLFQWLNIDNEKRQKCLSENIKQTRARVEIQSKMLSPHSLIERLLNAFAYKTDREDSGWAPLHIY